MYTMDKKFTVGCFAAAFLFLSLDYMYNVRRIDDKLFDVSIRQRKLENRLRQVFSESD